MIGAVMMWACFALVVMLAIGFLLCCAFMIFGIIWQRKDREMLLLYGLMLLFSAGGLTGLVFAAIAMGRNLL